MAVSAMTPALLLLPEKIEPMDRHIVGRASVCVCVRCSGGRTGSEFQDKEELEFAEKISRTGGPYIPLRIVM